MAKMEITGVVFAKYPTVSAWADSIGINAVCSNASDAIPLVVVIDKESGDEFFVRADVEVSQLLTFKGKLGKIRYLSEGEKCFVWEVVATDISVYEVLAPTRVNLDVAYEEKDSAKALGARWDPSEKCWYIPSQTPYHKFDQWIPETERGFYRAASFEIARADRNCWRCESRTYVYCFVIPPGSMSSTEQLTLEERFLSYIEFVSDDVKKIANQYAPTYKPAFSKTMDATYWMNRCTNCSATQGDFMLHSEPGEPFCPVDDEQMKKIIRISVAHEFIGC